MQQTSIVCRRIQWETPWYLWYTKRVNG